jgi:hypothetical protein
MKLWQGGRDPLRAVVPLDKKRPVHWYTPDDGGSRPLPYLGTTHPLNWNTRRHTPRHHSLHLQVQQFVQYSITDTRFEVTAVLMKIQVFCDVMPCRLVKSYRPLYMTTILRGVGNYRTADICRTSQNTRISSVLPRTTDVQVTCVGVCM